MTEQQQRVNRLVERLERHQREMGMSDASFVARYQRHLCSTDSWKRRLVARDWAALGRSLSKWEQRLARMVAEIEGTADLENFMPEMPIAQYGMAVWNTLQGQTNDRRCSWLIGPTGIGKSWTMSWLVRENRSGSAYLHVNRAWKDNMTAVAGGLAKASGAALGNGGAATYRNVVDTLRAQPMTIAIDDVHEGGLLLIRLVKHLVDETLAKFILGTYPTGWRMLLRGYTDAHSEAQQLIGRSLKPINNTWIDGLTAPDIAAYLRGRLGKRDEWRVVADRLKPMVQRMNLRVLADAIELAEINAADKDEEVTPAMIEAAVTMLCQVEGSKR